MLVAHFRGSGSLCKIFGIDRIAPWVGCTHACNGALAGLAADGITVVKDNGLIERGYFDFEKQLRDLGAEIAIIK